MGRPADLQDGDGALANLLAPGAELSRLHTGCAFAEGPAYLAAQRCLVWSDIPNDRLLRFSEADGTVAVFRQPSGHANGNTVDRDGRLVTCEHGGRRVSRTERDGSVITLADRWQGRRFNSPNDVVVKSDASIWFTDPTYGLRNDYGAPEGEAEIEAATSTASIPTPERSKR